MSDQTIEITSQPDEGLLPHSKKVDIEKDYQNLIENIDEGFCVIDLINNLDGDPVEFDDFVKAISHLGLYWLIINHGPKK